MKVFKISRQEHLYTRRPTTLPCHLPDSGEGSFFNIRNTLCERAVNRVSWLNFLGQNHGQVNPLIQE